MSKVFNRFVLIFLAATFIQAIPNTDSYQIKLTIKGYEGKEVIIANHYGDKQYDYVSQFLMNPALSPLARLKQFYNTMIGFNVSEGCKNGCLIGNISQEMGGISENMAIAADRNFNKIIRLISRCIRESQDAGEVRTDFPAEELANYLHNSFYGALVRTKAGGDPLPFTVFSKMAFEFLETK